MNDNEKASIILVSTIQNVFEYANKLLTSDLFRDVTVLQTEDIYNRASEKIYLLAFLTQRIKSKSIEKKLAFIRQYDDIRIFNDYTEIGCYLNYSNIGFHLIEDGLDTFKNFDHYKVHGNGQKIKNVMHRLFGVPYAMAQSGCCLDVEVNSNSDLLTNLKYTTIEEPRTNLTQYLSNKNVSILKKIFELDIPLSEKPKCLILTQPLTETSACQTKEEQLNFYKNVVAKYGEEMDVYIKPHPRDDCDYSNMSNVIIISAYAPIEIINFDEQTYFDRVVTYSSTAIDGIQNCGERIVLYRAENT